MSHTECDREYEVFELAQAGRWDERCDPELRAHIDACASCGEIAAVAGAIAADIETVMPRVHVPPSGVIWWRSQRRARQEAITAAQRATTMVQAISVAVGLAVTLAIFSAFVDLTIVLDWAKAGLEILGDVKSVLSVSLPAAILIAASLAIAPVAVYFVARER